MRWYAGAFVVVLLMCSAPAAKAGQRLYVDSVRTNLLLQAQAAILDDRFDTSDSLARCIIEVDPSDPAGYISLAASQLARMIDAEDNLYGGQYTTLLDSVTKLCESPLSTAAPDRKAWLYLFLGHAQAYRALYESKFGSAYRAVRMGLRTRESYEAGLTADSTLNDLYFGLGSYHYWKSVKAGLFRWVGLFHNDIERGIEELHFAADSSIFSRPVSLAALAWVWLDREQYDSVAVVTRPLRLQFPRGKSFLWPLAKAQYDSKDFTAAVATYIQIRQLLEPNPGNHFNMVECDFYIAKCYEKLSQNPRVLACAARIAAYEKYVSGEVRIRQGDKIRYLKKLAESVETTASSE